MILRFSRVSNRILSLVLPDDRSLEFFPREHTREPSLDHATQPITLSIMVDQPRILRPRPRRVFDVTPASTESSGPPTPAESTGTEYLNPQADTTSNSTSVSRTGSVMNLTSSTLYGIYSPTAFDGLRDESSPWGTEANTPAAEIPPEPSQRAAEKSAIEPRRLALRRTRSRLSQGLFRGVILPQVLSSVLLFGFGVAYGVITLHLHENHWITPVKLENIHYYDSWQYLGFWGLAGIALGNLLPWLDSWRDDELDKAESNSDEESEDRTSSWVAVARSVGAFVGIAFAMVSIFVLILTWLFDILRGNTDSFPPHSDDSLGNLPPKHRLPWPSRTPFSGT